MLPNAFKCLQTLANVSERFRIGKKSLYVRNSLLPTLIYYRSYLLPTLFIPKPVFAALRQVRNLFLHFSKKSGQSGRSHFLLFGKARSFPVEKSFRFKREREDTKFGETSVRKRLINRTGRYVINRFLPSFCELLVNKDKLSVNNLYKTVKTPGNIC